MEKLRELMTESDGDITSMKQTYTEEIAELMAVIKAQEEKIAHLEALQQRDSTNTNLPTGQTPPGRNKHIPNSRRNTGKPRGGQVGHEQHTLAAPVEDEITDEVDHFVERDEVCPECGSDNYTYTGKYEDRYVTDIEIIIHRIRHKYWIVRCNDCGEEFHTEIAPDLRAKCQYGPNFQAVILSMLNTVNSSMNKVSTFISGITNGEVRPSEGYIAKVQERGANALAPFVGDMKQHIIASPLVFWDDTVIFANTKRTCLRFYGNERLALFMAHERKDLKGILEDGILQVLTKEQKVMHDHNTVNYNHRFCFQNLECTAHREGSEKECRRDRPHHFERDHRFDIDDDKGQE